MPPPTESWMTIRDGALYGYVSDKGKSERIVKKFNEPSKDLFIVRYHMKKHPPSLQIRKRSKVVYDDPPFLFLQVERKSNDYDDRPELFVFRQSRGFRTFSAFTCHNVQHTRRWTFCKHDTNPIEDYFYEVFDDIWLVPKPRLVTRQTCGNATFVTYEWKSTSAMLVDMCRYFSSYHAGLPQIVGLNIPYRCKIARGIKFSQGQVFEKYISWDIECTGSSDVLPCGRNPNDRLLQISATIFTVEARPTMRCNLFILASPSNLKLKTLAQWQKILTERLAKSKHPMLKNTEIKPVRIFACATEKVLISSFHKMIESEKPTCLIGYNQTSFDVPFIKDKEIITGVTKPFPIINIRRKIFAETKRIDFDFPGVACIDMILEMKTAQTAEFRLDQVSEERNQSLDYFAKKFLNDEKEKMDHHVVQQCAHVYLYWKRGGDGSADERLALDLMYYGLKDTILPYLLARKFGVLATKREIAKIFNCPIEAVTMQGITAQYPYYYMAQMDQRGCPDVIPTPFDISCSPTLWDIGHVMSLIDHYYSGLVGGNTPPIQPPYEGAFVTPMSGLWVGVAIFDFSSLYPSMIQYGNLGRETIVGHEDEQMSHAALKCTRWTFPRLDGNSKVVYIRKDRESVLAELLRKTLAARKEIKGFLKTETDEALREVYSAQEQAMKIVSNSLYGGTATGAFADRRISEMTTAFARMAFFNVYNAVVAAGYSIINGDTDSIMVPDIQSEEKAKKICNAINNALADSFGPNALTLEFERYASHLWVLNSKKYVFRVKCPPCVKCNNTGYHIIYKGLKLVKGDTPEYIKNFEKDIIYEVLSASEDDRDITRHILQTTRKLLDKIPSLPFSNFVTKQKVRSVEAYKNKNLPQVCALQQKLSANDQHTPGDRIRYVLCWTSDEEGQVDESAIFHGPKDTPTLPKYKRVKYVPTNCKEISMPFGTVAKAWRIHLPSILQNICLTAQAYFASNTYIEDRIAFCAQFNRLAQVYFPNFKRPKKFSPNKSIPAGLVDEDSSSIATRYSDRLPQPSPYPDNIYHQRVQLGPII